MNLWQRLVMKPVIEQPKAPSTAVASRWLVDRLDRDVWPNFANYPRTNMHLCNLFISALSNVARTGRTVNNDDKKFLTLVLSFQCGWSATAVEHMGDPGFCYIRHRWSHLDLMPILDDMTYEEEVRWMPKYISCERVTTILLASKDRFYVYDAEDDSLLDAGSTLEEVYNGLRQFEYVYGLPEVPPYMRTWPESYYYFPDYERDRTLMFEVTPFHPDPDEIEDWDDWDDWDDENQETDPVDAREGCHEPYALH
jgi:hypothetical protein